MALIPYPNETTLGDDVFIFNADIGINCPFDGAKKLLCSLMEKRFGAALKQGNEIEFLQNEKMLPEEYSLSITTDKIKIECLDNGGATYAVQTLRLLASLDQGGDCAPCCFIGDKPRYGWRGVSFDVSRYFFDINELKRFISLMSLLKLNKLHLHLSDDQGFRVQIDKYPELNKIGSYRAETHVKDGANRFDGAPHGGFFTKDEIRELVRYANDFCVEIIPEIDLPGHTRAIVAAFPRLSCHGRDIPVWTDFGIARDILCGGNEETYAVVKDILDEICELFPSKYIHLGGDEAPKQNWKECEKCQEKIKSLNLKDENDLQAYFFNYFAKYLEKKGKTVIGWNECLNDSLDKNIVCQHWTPKTAGKNHITAAHANNGRKIIVSDFLKTYLDYPYAMTPMKKTYGFDALTTLPLLNEKGANCVLGVECNIWCEWIPNRAKLDFTVFPRIVAFAENAWRADRLPYSDFVARLQKFYGVLDALGVGYAKNKEKPDNIFRRIAIMKKFFTKDAFVELNEQQRTENI